MVRALLFSVLLLHGVLAQSDLPPGVVNTQKSGDRPLPPLEALKKITVPPGFNVALFAGEPDVRQPIAFDFDDRGRLWVVECFYYPDAKNTNSDRVLIFEDKDGDGRFDERKIFLEGGQRLTGIAFGHGGIWLAAAPYLLFVADADGDDRPDGKPVILLDGFTLNAGHNMVNGLAWGPDGWLYGRHGITDTSRVGRPGTAPEDRAVLNCSIWRYHPVRKTFEVVVHGTTNPWGLDWDDYGEAFFSNNVIGHLWHVIPGAHYQRMFGQDFNPYTYELLASTSDHLHWAGSDWTKSREGKGEHDVLGGGHSHCGGMIYLGDNWPSSFRQTFMMVNIHGNRLIYDQLKKKGSGYVASHGSNFLMANDPWFRGVHLQYGPDGGVFVTDWNDFGECHDSDGSYRLSGRIYKITYGKTTPKTDLNLARLTSEQLVDLCLHQNDWFVRHARRLLQERSLTQPLPDSIRQRLEKILSGNPDVTRKLRALWALHAAGLLKETLLESLLAQSNEHLRIWAIRLLSEKKSVTESQLNTLVALARKDQSAQVRMRLASAAQRYSSNERWPLLEALLAREEDASDTNLSLMLWYGLEPLVLQDQKRSIQLLTTTKNPRVREFIARRLAAQ